ncbi:MAG: FGGY family carbohydrate kinase [Myxococcota bacterium]
MPELLLGLDVGSTSVRARVVDLEGRLLGSAGRRLRSRHPAPGRTEQDPNEVWESSRASIDGALAEAGRRLSDVGALGLATQRASVVLWDRESGEPAAPMVLWSDLRGIERARELGDAGFLAPPLAAVSKLEAALDAVPDGRARAAAGRLCWGTIDSYLVHRLTGGALHVTDLSNAWPTCYLDMRDVHRWNAKLIEHQGLEPRMFPALCDTIGRLGRTAASALGTEVPIGAIVADQQSGMLAHGLWSPGGWKATYGTSAALMVCTGPAPRLIPGLLPLLQLARGEQLLFAAEGMVNSAGALLDWLIGDLGLLSSVEELTDLAARVEDSGGVAIRPALQGLGAPHHDPEARAAVVGLSRASGKGQIARAALESIAFRVREIADAVEASPDLEVPTALRVDGGLTANDLFLQIHADLLGRPIERHADPEATGLGACLGAALGCGLLGRDDLDRFAKTDRTFEPRIHPDQARERLARWQRAVSLDEESRAG